MDKQEELRQHYGGLIASICLKHNVMPENIYGKSRIAYNVAARKELAALLREQGLSWNDIGILMSRNRTSAMYLAGALPDKQERERQRHINGEKNV